MLIIPKPRLAPHCSYQFLVGNEGIKEKLMKTRMSLGIIEITKQNLFLKRMHCSVPY